MKVRVQAQELLYPNLANSRYFRDFHGNAVVLAGSHQWFNFQNWSGCRTTLRNAPNVTDFDAHLDLLKSYGHNFTRLWVWENTRWDWTGCNTAITPEIYTRSATPGAGMGGNKADLTTISSAFLNELEARVRKAWLKDVYVSVMFFQGLSVGSWVGISAADNMWNGHPYKSNNNINSLNGDPNSDGHGWETQNCTDLTCAGNPAITRQKEYVAAVIDRLQAYPNVIWEIGNELNPGAGVSQTHNWMKHIVAYIHNYERVKGYTRHPVWVSKVHSGGAGSTASQLASIGAEIGGNGDDDATWVVPAVNSHGLPIIDDSDHYNMDLATADAIWKQFMRGYNVAIMDCLPSDCSSGGPNDAARYAAGDGLRYLSKLNLNNAVPWDNTTTAVGKCGTTFCLGNDIERQYLMFFPNGSTDGAKNLTTATGATACEWYNVSTRTTAACLFPGTGARNYTAPAAGPHVLYVH